MLAAEEGAFLFESVTDNMNAAIPAGRGQRWIGKISWLGELENSKYPPAKPGALVLEPLKAAWPCRTRQSVPSTLWNAPHLMTC
jgi:hypothetical protein